MRVWARVGTRLGRAGLAGCAGLAGRTGRDHRAGAGRMGHGLRKTGSGRSFRAAVGVGQERRRRAGRAGLVAGIGQV